MSDRDTSGGATMAGRRWTVSNDRSEARGTGVALVAAVILAVAASGGAVEPLGTGVWVYNTAMSITVYNLTSYELVATSNTLVRHGGCDPDESLPLQGLSALAYRSWMDVYYLNFRPVDPCSYSGSVVLEAKAQGGGSTLSSWPFEIAFESQCAKGLAEKGSWVWLRPHGEDQGWSTATSSTVHGRWATPIADLKMHNIMTLIGPKCMVALYSPDNTNLVIVVQQYDENAEGWHDADDYQGWKLDWVDNGSIYVPGQ